MYYYQNKNFYDKTDKRIDFSKKTVECLVKYNIPTKYLECQLEQDRYVYYNEYDVTVKYTQFVAKIGSGISDY